jgi:replicative DNA helicase
LNASKSLCQAGHKGIFFALEMGDVSITRRLLCDLIFDRHELPYFRIKSGNFTEKDFEHFRDAAMMAKDLPLKIEQQTGVTLSQIGARARQMKRKTGLDFMVVDHMGHVQASDRYAGSKVNEMGEISTGLLRLSRDLDIAVIALCQLNRGVESRPDKRPNLADLRASGNLEEDAATVIMVYREAYYLANREPKPGTPEYELWQNEMMGCYDKLQILIEKQREGPSGAIQAFVNPACNAVRDFGWTRGYIDEAVPDERFVF